MTPTDLDALQAAEERATPGPWKAIPQPINSTVTSQVIWEHDGAYSPTEITGVCGTTLQT